MIDQIHAYPFPFLTRKRQRHVPVILLTESRFKSWLKKQTKPIQAALSESSFKAKANSLFIVRNAKGEIESVLAGVKTPLSLYDLSYVSKGLNSNLSESHLKKVSFYLEASKLSDDEINKAYIGWALGCYEFTVYKDGKKIHPSLLWDKAANKKRVESFVSALCLLKNLINTPANDMSPEALEQSARRVSRESKAKTTSIKGDKLLEENFPLIHMVGKAGHEPPRLVELNWGKKTDPKVTIVGKGVTFDTGGLNIKPTQYMKLMKKDMGGAAHAIALAKLIIENNLPIQLKLLLPIVENAISDNAFRPGDIVKSRIGKTVENTNTDAEGRLILADTLTYASEGKPELIIDYATLTGSARAALGPDIPPFFCTSDKLASKLAKLSIKAEDPVWRMPLWEPYNKHIRSHSADLHNSASLPGDLIYSALFLKSFLHDGPEWLHLDVYAWEQYGSAGRLMGGADTGLRAAYALLEDQYGTK